MNIIYDATRDMLRILFSNAPIFETNRQTRGVTFDYDQYGRLVGLELEAASKHVANPYGAHIVTNAATECQSAPIRSAQKETIR